MSFLRVRGVVDCPVTVMSGEGELVKDVFPWSERGVVDCPVTVTSGEGESVKDVFTWSEKEVLDCPSVTIMSGEGELVFPWSERGVVDCPVTVTSGEGELVKDVFPWIDCPSVEIHFELEKQGTNDLVTMHTVVGYMR